MSPKLLPLAAVVVSLFLTAARGDGPSAELIGQPVSGAGRELTALAFDRDDILWIGSRYGGIYACRQGQFYVCNAYNTPIPDDGIAAICVDQHNTKWFASTRGYVFSFDGERWRVILESKATREMLGRIASIRSDTHDRIWIVTEAGHLFCLDKGRLEAVDPDSKVEAGDGKSPKKADRIMNGQRNEVRCLDFDRSGNLWAGGNRGLFCFDGAHWTCPGDSQMQQMEIPKLWCNSKTDEIYLISAGVDFKENPFGLPTGKLFAFKAGRSRVVTDELPESRIEVLRGNQEGRFVVGYIAPDGAIVGDGKQVRRYAVGTPLENESVADVAFDKQGRIWFAARFRGLCCLDNGKWKTFPPPDRNDPIPLPVWQKKPLQDLVRQEAVDVDIHKVLEDPRKYADKKLRIVGTIASSFEYAEMIDSRGEKLGMWPNYRMLQNAFGQPEGHTGDRKPERPLQEFLGYLEWGGHFGHMSAWPMQFTIVEVYPADMDKSRKVEIQKQYLTRVEKESYDWPVSEYLPETAELQRLRERLQGAWIIEDLQAGNQSTRLRGGKGSRWIVSGDRLTTGSPGYWSRGTLRIDPSRKPAALDYYSSDSDPNSVGPRMLLGIVSIEGERLQACLSAGWNMEQPRPRDFKSDSHFCTVVYSLQRDRSWSPPGTVISAEPDDAACIAALKKSDTRLEYDDHGNVLAAEFGFIQVNGYHPATDAMFAFLRGLRHLERVDINGGDLSDEGLKSLAHCRDLVSLGVGGNHVTDAGLETLGGLTRLERLRLDDTNVTDAGLEKLKDLKRLKVLQVSSLAFTGSGLDSLSGCSALEGLQLGGPKLTDDVFRHVAKFPALRSLRFFATKIGDSQAADLGSCVNLEELWLDGTKFGDTGMKYVHSLKKLKVLRVGDTLVTDAGVANLAGLTAMEEIFVYGTRVTDAGLRSLEDLPKLRRLWLIGTSVTTVGVERLKRLPDLEELFLNGTRIDNDGLNCLKSFPKLRTVGLSGPRVTREAAESLRKELPTLNVSYENTYRTK